MVHSSPWHGRAIGSTAGVPVDLLMARQALLIFADPTPGRVMHFQAKPSWKCRLAPGNDLDTCLDAVQLLDQGDSIYWGLNPVSSELKLSPSHRDVRASDVVCRRWLFLDPDRAKTLADLKLSATEEEKAAVMERARLLYDCTADELGWPVPVLTDSGNGAGLFWRIDLPNDKLSQTLVRAVTHALGKRFNNDRVEIDPATHNADRVAKLPGSWARKGPDTAERPHRQCKLLHVPSTLDVLPLEALQALAGTATRTDSPKPAASPTPWQGKAGATDPTAYARAALERECWRMACTAPGELNEQLFLSGARLGELVGAGLLSEDEVFASLQRAGKAAGCDSPAKDDDTLRRGIAKGKTNPRQVPERNGAVPSKSVSAASATGGESAETERWAVDLDGLEIAEGSADDLGTVSCQRTGVVRYEILTGPELLRRQFPEPNWVVPGILSEGLNLLAGKPKQGKSMLALNLALTIAAGGNALGKTKVEPGDVLYLSLEDKQRRVQYRAGKMLKGLVLEADRRFAVTTSWPRQDRGGLQLLEHWRKKVARPTLVIIDTWALFRPPASNRGSAYDQDYQHMSEVKHFLDEWACCSLILHHCRKAASTDVLEEISGTMGLSGVADGILILLRSRNDNDAKIYVTGRDVQEQEIALRFDPDTMTWTDLGPADVVLTGKLQTKIVAYLKDRNGQAAFTPDIAAHLNESPDKVRPVLHRLFERKIVARKGNAWLYPGEEAGTEEVVA